MTSPIDPKGPQMAPHLTIAPSYTAPDGSVYVHQDLVKASEPWTTEAHVSPIRTTERFGDIESWAAYVVHFAGAEEAAALLTWSETGLRAVLDYHTQAGDPGRTQWIAEHPFTRTVQWTRWSRIADGHGKSQQEVLEFFEDNAPDIKAPPASQIATILRTLRATVNVTAETTLSEDGSTALSYAKTAGVKSTGDLTMPPSIVIGIPLLKGHTALTDDGRVAPVLYELEVRVRVNVGANDRPAFRLTIPRSEHAFESVFADRVQAARMALGDSSMLLRAAGG